QAMENSCNTTFAQLAVEVGADDMLEQAERFGFNDDEWLEDLPMEKSVFPLEPDAAQTGQTGIGQFEVAATPLQMAMVTASIANGGIAMRPYLVDELSTSSLQVLKRTKPKQYGRAVSAATSRELTELLVSTVSNGTASPAQ